MICPACGLEKGDEFPAKNGKLEKWWCIDCKRRYHRNHGAKRRAEGKVKEPSLKQRRDKAVKSGGLRPDEYEDLIAWQDSKCAICLKDKDEQLSIDHNIATLKSAIEYLQRYPPESDPLIDITQISGRYIDGQSEQRIAYDLGTTRRFVHDTLIRLGVPRRQLETITDD
jgi:5-methylcytosine-specific restriction endonuclease McrA